MAKQKKEFHEWRKDIARLIGCQESDFSENAYRQQYDDGLTPREAIAVEFGDNV